MMVFIGPAPWAPMMFLFCLPWCGKALKALWGATETKEEYEFAIDLCTAPYLAKAEQTEHNRLRG